MSVIIRGMKMPETCVGCVLDRGGYCEGFEIPRAIKFKTDHITRMDWCPLIELSHHGRLVDVEWLKLSIAITLEHLTRHPLMSEKEIMLKSAFKTLELMVDDAPTVIEAWEEVSE